MSDQLARLSAALADRYHIDRELGAGGMATVYLAEDLKHNRKVAVKVLKPELAVAIGAERFLAEIKTTANLQHPHILALHDSGEVNGTVFYVMPYVEGESLRDRLDREKQLPVNDALRIAGEVADALQYAHERGVIHRDIKPENILLQRGHAVVADFGIALAASKTGGARMTETGMSLGTPTYMSPEQAMGSREVDARTDIYSLGCVLYEMLTGEPPFVGPTAQSIVAKVITESPKSVTGQRHTVPPHVDDAIQTALEKLPADRFESAGAFAEALRNERPSARAVAHRSSHSTRWSRSRALLWGGAALAAVVLGIAAYQAGRRSSSSGASSALSMEQKTYRYQTIFVARYTSSGDGVVYSAAETGSIPTIYSLTPAYPLPRPLGDSGIHLLSVSSKDELAVLVGESWSHHRVFTGTLARMPMGGGAPRELLTSVRDADWSPDGSQLTVVHEVNGKDQLEYPIGTVIYETEGYLSDVRMSHDGQRIAFLEHPQRGDDRGMVATVDLRGAHRLLTPQYLSLEGLAWTPEGRLVFSASTNGGIMTLSEVTVDGKIKPGVPGVGNAIIHDIGRDGRRLIVRDDYFKRIWVKRAADSALRDLSWLDISFFPLLSSDGSILVYGDGSSAAGENYATMLRRTDGSAAVRLGEGSDLAISPDKQWVMSVLPTAPMQLMIYPTGAGSSRRLDKGEFASIDYASFLGDGKEIVVCGSEPRKGSRCYQRSVSGGEFRPFTPEGVRSMVASVDGRFIVSKIGDSYRRILVSDGSSQVVPGLKSTDLIIRVSPDGNSVWTRQANVLPLRIERIDLQTGMRSRLLPDFVTHRAVVLSNPEVALADDPHTYAYVERESASYLFELKGMH
ncbi:MAG TPA: protein kinase [Gemmatimonadaceae bacterium]|nr:protein kinase [Gemmatimonadaceae bacterium]